LALHPFAEELNVVVPAQRALTQLVDFLPETFHRVMSYELMPISCPFLGPSFWNLPTDQQLHLFRRSFTQLRQRKVILSMRSSPRHNWKLLRSSSFRSSSTPSPQPRLFSSRRSCPSRLPTSDFRTSHQPGRDFARSRLERALPSQRTSLPSVFGRCGMYRYSKLSHFLYVARYSSYRIENIGTNLFPVFLNRRWLRRRIWKRYQLLVYPRSTRRRMSGRSMPNRQLFPRVDFPRWKVHLKLFFLSIVILRHHFIFPVSILSR
jgi:hypothetical protein